MKIKNTFTLIVYPIFLKIVPLVFLCGLGHSLSPFSVFSQNLVPNPSFEEYSECPDNTNQVPFAGPWMNFGNTPDYFNSCSTNLAGVPYNAVGYQFPASGEGMCGLTTFASPFLNYRELIGVQLISPLEVGIKYFVSLKINYSNSSIYYNCAAANKIGLKFTNTSYSENNPAPIDNNVDVFTDSIVSDTSGWFMIFGSFVPNTSFQYAMIGNFFNDSNTDTTMICNLNQTSYYYLDDICVSTDSSYAYNFNYVGLNELKKNLNVTISPNPSNGEFKIVSDTKMNECKIYTSLGLLMYMEELHANETIFKFSGLPRGIYFAYISTQLGTTRKKIIIN